VYDLSTTVVLRSDLVLLGYGATLLKQTAGYPLSGTGVSNVTVAGFTFDLAGQGWGTLFIRR
jgi:hypothetical protein